MTDQEKSEIPPNVHAVFCKFSFWQFALFCREIRFVSIYTHLQGGRLSFIVLVEKSDKNVIGKV